MTEKKRKRIHYKRAAEKNDGKKSLEHLLLRAMQARPKARDRMRIVSQDGDEVYRLINHFEEGDVLSCGLAMTFTKGLHQSVVSLEDDAEEFDLSRISPLASGAKQHREFVNGLHFFGVKRNHVVILPSAHFPVQRFESHVNWLLHDTKLLSGTDEFMLLDHVAPSLRTRIRGVRSVGLSAPLEFSQASADAPVAADDSELRQKSVGWRIPQFLSDALGVETPVVDLRGGVPEHELRVDLSVRILHQRKPVGRRQASVLDPFANALRHVDDAPVTLTLTDGNEINVSDFKVREHHQIDCDDGVPNPTHVFATMRTWFRKLLEHEEIDAA